MTPASDSPFTATGPVPASGAIAVSPVPQGEWSALAAERPEGCGFGGRVRVKICGLTSAKDAEAAIHAGADALGFNSWKGSRRYLDLQSAAGWIAQLPVFVARVALCVNSPLEEAVALARASYIDVVQLHGDEPVDYVEAVIRQGVATVRAVRLNDEGQIPTLSSWGTRHVLVDAAVPGAFGGTGARLDSALAATAVRLSPGLSITLAGGLDPENVAEAVRAVRPYAVDVASGVESEPGRKDWIKMRDFVQAVQGA